MSFYIDKIFAEISFFITEISFFILAKISFFILEIFSTILLEIDEIKVKALSLNKNISESKL